VRRCENLAGLIHGEGPRAGVHPRRVRLEESRRLE
jgi:hypothetical protein